MNAYFQLKSKQTSARELLDSQMFISTCFIQEAF